MFRFAFLIFLIFFGACSKNKTAVAEQDVNRVLERLASQRVQEVLKSSENELAATDKELVDQISNLFHLDSKSVWEGIRKKNPSLYSYLRGEAQQ